MTTKKLRQRPVTSSSVGSRDGYTSDSFATRSFAPTPNRTVSTESNRPSRPVTGASRGTRSNQSSRIKIKKKSPSRPVTGNQRRPKIGQSRSVTGQSRPVTGQSRPVTGQSRPVTGHSPVTDQRPATGNRSQAGTPSRPVTSYMGTHPSTSFSTIDESPVEEEIGSPRSHHVDPHYLRPNIGPYRPPGKLSLAVTREMHGTPTRRKVVFPEGQTHNNEIVYPSSPEPGLAPKRTDDHSDLHFTHTLPSVRTTRPKNSVSVGASQRLFGGTARMSSSSQSQPHLSVVSDVLSSTHQFTHSHTSSLNNLKSPGRPSESCWSDAYHLPSQSFVRHYGETEKFIPVDIASTIPPFQPEITLSSDARSQGHRFFRQTQTGDWERVPENLPRPPSTKLRTLNQSSDDLPEAFLLTYRDLYRKTKTTSSLPRPPSTAGGARTARADSRTHRRTRSEGSERSASARWRRTQDPLLSPRFDRTIRQIWNHSSKGEWPDGFISGRLETTAPVMVQSARGSSSRRKISTPGSKPSKYKRIQTATSRTQTPSRIQTGRRKRSSPKPPPSARRPEHTTARSGSEVNVMQIHEEDAGEFYATQMYEPMSEENDDTTVYLPPDYFDRLPTSQGDRADARVPSQASTRIISNQDRPLPPKPQSARPPSSRPQTSARLPPSRPQTSARPPLSAKPPSRAPSATIDAIKAALHDLQSQVAQLET